MGLVMAELATSRLNISREVRLDRLSSNPNFKRFTPKSSKATTTKNSRREQSRVVKNLRIRQLRFFEKKRKRVQFYKLHSTSSGVNLGEDIFSLIPSRQSQRVVMRTEFGGNIPPLGCSPIAVPILPMRTAGRAVAKVVHRCQDAEENQNLDLSECQLMHVPDGVYHLMRNTIVLWCNLSFNVIRKLSPKFVFKFNNITDLNVSSNQLSSLPDELQDLSDMKRLDISHNHFDSLPNVIFKMSQLTHLNAEHNHITEINVSQLSHMTSLKEVNLSNNPLTQECRDQLKALKKIVVHLNDYSNDELDMELDDLQPE